MKRLLLAAGFVLLAATPAHAQPGSKTVGTKTLTVSAVSNLDPKGQQVRVTGKGYDSSKGIYVAFCVDTGVGNPATPCGGGADTEGSSGNSVWISSFPPYYGTGLAKPYGKDGSFDVTINVRAQLNDTTSCLKAKCAVVTRNDHTRSDDRSQDVRVPITFQGAAPATQPPSAAPMKTGTTTSAPVIATASPSADLTVAPTVTPTTSPTAAPTTSTAPTAETTDVALPRSEDVTPVATKTSDGGDGVPWVLGGAAVLLVAAAGGVWWRVRA